MLASVNRLDACASEPGATDRREFGHARACLECGAPFTPYKSDAEFCCAEHRKAWNNRRATRGAELLDLCMAWRFDRRVATGLHILTAISRLIAGYRRQDHVERAGRRSWAPPATVIARKPHLRGERLAQVEGRGD